MKILSIGNSYSQDAQRYLHELALSEGDSFKTINMMIGGCTLERHYRNMLSGKPAYNLEMNGYATGFTVSLQDALASDCFDVITVQQQSSNSANYDTFQPYLHEILSFVRKYQPKARIYLHQTWAYENTEVTMKKFGYICPEEMFAKVKASYDKAVKDEGVDGVMPSGLAFENLRALGIKKYHRDPIHASLGLGRFTLALTWYCKLTGKDPMTVRPILLDEPITEEEFSIAKAAVKKTLEA